MNNLKKIALFSLLLWVNRTLMAQESSYHPISPQNSENTFYILLIISLLSFIGVLFLLWKQFRMREKIVVVVRESERLKKYFQKQLITQLKEKKMTDEISEILTPKVLYLLQEDLKITVEKRGKKTIQLNENGESNTTKKQQNPNLFYASVVEERVGCFYNVSDTPNEDTIFELRKNEENPHLATFRIYNPVIAKIIKIPDFVTGAADIQILGNSKVQILELGQAKLNEMNKWAVIQKIKINVI